MGIDRLPDGRVDPRASSRFSGATGTRVALLLLLLLGFLARVYGLGEQELRGDEAFGYFFSLRPYAEIIDASIELREPHPVASYYVQKSWLAVAGDNEFALRFPSAWFSLLAVALLYRLARRLEFPRHAGLLAGALMAINPYVIWHSQDARMYSMSLALSLAAVLFAVEALQRQRATWGLAYVVTAWLALHTHYYGAFVLVALNLFVFSRALFVPRTRANLSMWVLWQLLVGVLYLPWLLRVASIMTGYEGNGDSPAFAAMAVRSLSVFAVGESVPATQRLLWAGVAGGLLLLGCLRLGMGSPRDRRTLGLLVLYLAAPVLAIWYSAQSRPIFNERYLVASAPPFFLLLAAAFAQWRVGRPAGLAVRGAATLLLTIILAGSLLSLNGYYTNPSYSKTRGWRELAETVTRLSAGLPGDQVRIAQNFPDPTIWYYYRRPVAHIVLPPAAHAVGEARRAVDDLVGAGVTRVLLPLQPAPNWDDGGIAAEALSGAYVLAATREVGVWPVQVYARPAGVEVAPAARFVNGVELHAAQVAPSQLVPQGMLVVFLEWRGDPKRLAGSEKVFVQILDSAGQLVAQDDRPLVLANEGTGVPAVYAVPLPEELPAGTYRLITGLYDPAAEGAPRVPMVTGGDFVPLLELAPAAK